MESISAKTLHSMIVQGIEVYDLREKQSVAYLFLEEKYNLKRTDILSEKKIEFDQSQIDEFVSRINAHEPLQYILGKTWFYGLPFHVRAGVLIPRPETEELVDLILKEHKNKSNLNILDIGTGSGCIAVSLASNLNTANVSAMDISTEALRIASENAVLNDVSINFIQHDISQVWKGVEKFDIIVSNPPYVELSEQTEMRENVLRFEPKLALYAPENDPLFFYRKILEFAALHLNAGGSVYYEINERFGMETKDLMFDFGFQNIEVLKDMNGRDRMVRGLLIKE